MHASCAARHHAYEPKPAGPGSVCKRCGKAWQPPIGRKNSRAAVPALVTTQAAERPPGDSAPTPAPRNPPTPPASPVAASADDAAALAAALGMAPPVPSAETALAPASEPPPDPARSFWTPVSKRVVKGYIAILEEWMDAKGREAGEPDEDEVAKMGEALGELACKWFGAVELSPGKQVLVSATFIAGEMWANGRKIEKPKKDDAGSADGGSNARTS